MRPDWNEYFMMFADLASLRATCIRRQVGAVLVSDNRIIATGYNGAPKGIPHCTRETCLRAIHNVPSGTHHELCRGVHAEQNLICQAAYHGVSTRESSVYTSLRPCSICLKILINAGVSTIYYFDEYPDPLTDELMKTSDIKFIKLIRR